MMDVVPDNTNKAAFVLGKVFHPYIICVPTLFAVLNEFTFSEALGWSALVLAMLFVPGFSFVAYLKRQGKEVYERRTRDPLYLMAWFSVLACLLVLVVLSAPRVLLACIAALAVWLPLQLVINSFVTKVSTHAAVVAGCTMGLVLLGKLDNLWLVLLVLVSIFATAWARVVTKNHTVPQVVMGLLTGSLPVLIVFPLMLC